MQLRTSRFGALRIEPEDILSFPAGLLGLETCHEWVLLADAQNESLGWLQSSSRPEIALAVVSPRRFVPDYQFRVFRSELSPLELSRLEDAQVLVIVGRNEQSITLNLRAPVVINLDRRLGRQVVTNNDHPTQYELASDPVPLKKSA